MKSLQSLNLVVIVALFLVGCNKESLNKDGVQKAVPSDGIALQNVIRKPLWQELNLDKVLGGTRKDPAIFGEKLDELNKKSQDE